MVGREAEVYGSVLGCTVVVAKNASVESVMGKQVRVGKGLGRPFGGRGGCYKGFGNSGFVSVCCEAGLSSKAGIGETRKIDLPSLPLDSSFQRPSKSEAFGNSGKNRCFHNIVYEFLSVLSRNEEKGKTALAQALICRWTGVAGP